MADGGLTKPVEEGDYNGLVDCMGHLMAVKERSTTTDAMFEPLKQSIELLKAYDQELSEETHTLLQVSFTYIYFYHFIRQFYVRLTKNNNNNLFINFVIKYY